MNVIFRGKLMGQNIEMSKAIWMAICSAELLASRQRNYDNVILKVGRQPQLIVHFLVVVGWWHKNH